MNTNNIKRYAPKARTAFIVAMTKRAALFGIRESNIPNMGIEPLEQKGDLALIGDRPFPASIIRPRAALVKKVEQMGFAQAMEQAAYSWFNRLCAIRYMELKGYLEHGRCVLSHPDQPGSFQILDDCLDIELEGLDQQRIAELKLDGTKDEELYRELLLAQCHALHQAMPFLFEAVDDATELLLPDNLTKTDSLIRELVSAIPEEDWQDVEIIGWLYQFYISEKKDQVIGKVVKSEDIPAATQLFTPNWIVQYLVQNSVGHQWLQTYPNSPLKEKMPFYIEPAEQTAEVHVQLASIIPDSIDPLNIKVLDPACGSGHILVEAYKVLKEIYTERGHRSRDIPQLILEHNLFGLDIDDRAGQLAGFALMMLAREDDRRIFSRLAENSFKLNILSLQESSHLEFSSLWQALNLTSDWQRGQSQSLFDNEQTDHSAAQSDDRYQLLKTTLARFTQAKTFGSLIEVPAEDAAPLGELMEQLRQLAKDGDVMQKPAVEQLMPYIQQAWVLAQRYDAVVANPPYMGSKGMNAELKAFTGKAYPNSKSDMFAIFMEHAFSLLKVNGFNAQVNMQSWMFLSSYEKLREDILVSKTIQNLMQIGYNSFPELNSKVVQCAAYCIANIKIDNYKGRYINLNSDKQSEKKDELFRDSKESLIFEVTQDEFKKIPGSPIAYWVPNNLRSTFDRFGRFSDLATPRAGMITGNNAKFVRLWHEINIECFGVGFKSRSTAKESGLKWFPYQKGGEFRKWYGNNDCVVNWQDDGRELRTTKDENGKVPAHAFNDDYIFKPNVNWSAVSSSFFSARITACGSLFDAGGSAAFPGDFSSSLKLCGFLNSTVTRAALLAINPTLNFQAWNIGNLPVSIDSIPLTVTENVRNLFEITRSDWDSFEASWDFSTNPLIDIELDNLSEIYKKYVSTAQESISEVRRMEIENNALLLRSYDLSNMDNKDIPLREISLLVNVCFRYGKESPDLESYERLQSETISELLSYLIGCIMGRYSLDRKGLVYAHAGNQGFAELVTEGAYKTVPADSDGILPLTDQEWFADDATNRFREIIRTVWGDEHLQENLSFVAESLCLHAIKPKRGESALDTIRRYLSTQFFKDHLKIYKRRPIYWLFSSGKHKAFECLVYLHRYNEGTLARMRTEYVIPLTAKLNTYANKLATDIENETVTSEKKRLEKELATLHNQQAELATFDEKLRHHADQRISLDLDEGVKVNYSKFGDLLAEIKAVTGDKGD